MSMAAGTRCRVVTDTDGERHTSSTVLAPGECDGYLHTEAELHMRAGWSVVRFPEGIVCLKAGVTRRVWLRTLTPMDDA